MRPRYETAQDREREAIIAKRFCERWPVMPLREKKTETQASNGYSIDYAGLDEHSKTRLRFEAKYRKNEFGRYPTLFISLKKVEAARELWMKAINIPVFFAVMFSCGKFMYADLCYPAYREVKMGGREDRNDPHDKELVMHIQLDQMAEF